VGVTKKGELSVIRTVRSGRAHSRKEIGYERLRNAVGPSRKRKMEIVEGGEGKRWEFYAHQREEKKGF